MRILVTGAAGFIGRHVCRELRTHGHEVIGVDIVASDGVIAGDIGDRRWMRAVFCHERPRAVVHLAAAVSVADSARRPAKYLRSNALATAKLCEVIANARTIKRLVVASSMSVYGEGLPDAPVDEQWPISPASVYGLSKYDQERLCLLCSAQSNIPALALRLFNVYGPGQSITNSLTGVIANWAGAIIRGDRPRVTEDGRQLRDFIHVADAARAFRVATESNATGVFNIGVGAATSLYDAATMLADALGRPDITPIITRETRPGDVRHCFADIRRAQEWLAWAPTIRFADGVKMYAASLTAPDTPSTLAPAHSSARGTPPA